MILAFNEAAKNPLNSAKNILNSALTGLNSIVFNHHACGNVTCTPNISQSDLKTEINPLGLG